MGMHRLKRPGGRSWWSKRDVRIVLVSALILGASVTTTFLLAGDAPPLEIIEKFEDLSQSGNSSCSVDFMNSIASMPPVSRLKGSCCGPMALHRYSE